jgi:hypothetical protein
VSQDLPAAAESRNNIAAGRTRGDALIGWIGVLL